MDWGGTWTRTSVIDRQGEILWQSRIANKIGGTKQELLGAAESLLREGIAWCGERPIAGVGIAVAGPVDSETGELLDPPNLPLLNGVSLKALWEPSLGYPVWVGNDANLAALGEYRYGYGRETAAGSKPATTLLYVTVSTGIGGGVIHHGSLFLGSRGLTGEIGHTTIDYSDSAVRCQCGNKGCLEALASGTAIAATARSKVATGEFPASPLALGELENINSEDVFQAASDGDPLALEILDGAVQALSVGLTNGLHRVKPDLVVLGGGVTVGLSNLGYLDRIQSIMNQRAMSPRYREFTLVASRFGDSVGMIGAAALVWQQVRASA